MLDFLPRSGGFCKEPKQSPIPRVPAPMIEIVMPAVTVRVQTGVDAATLATVLATLRALA